MTLRVRLVGGLVLLMAGGLVLFGWVTYSLYSGSQYGQLDDQLRASVPLVTSELARTAGIAPGPGQGQGGPEQPGGGVSGPPSRGPGSNEGGGPGTSGGRPGGADLGRPPPSVLVAPGTFGELVSTTGAVVSHVQQVTSSSQPAVPNPLPATGSQPRILTVGSVSGSTRWRTFVGPQRPDGYRVVVAIPMSGVESSLHRLILIEVLGAFCLLVVLSLGAGLMVRRGLAPVERMARTADRIAAGDLSQRADATDPNSEVGKLGVAFNTMLDQIEGAFGERDATEARLRQFLADASHELKTPLTSIQGFAELFRLHADQKELDTATMMRRIEQESARMKGLVEDLLLLARLDQTREPARAPVDLSVVAADACGDVRAVAPDRPVTLVAPEPVVVPGDESHLRQAVANLVTNAVSHTPPGTAIEVGAELAEGAAVLSVRDHGAGLDDEALAHAFDRFWQKDPSRAGAGSGLGLSIVAGVVAEHGGTVTAGNAADGGAVFTIRLPVG